MGSLGVIFGNDLIIWMQLVNVVNNGRDVDGICIYGVNILDNLVFIIIGDCICIYVDGQDGDGINVGYNLLGQGWIGLVNIYVGDDLYIKMIGSQGCGIIVNVMWDVLCVKNMIVVGNCVYIVIIGDSLEGLCIG